MKLSLVIVIGAVLVICSPLGSQILAVWPSHKSTNAPVQIIEGQECNVALRLEHMAHHSNDGILSARLIIAAEPDASFDIFIDGRRTDDNPVQCDHSGNATVSITLPVDRLIHQVYASNVKQSACAAVIPVSTCNTTIDLNPGHVTRTEHLTLYPNPFPLTSRTLTIQGLPENQFGNTCSIRVFRSNATLLFQQKQTCAESMSIEIPEMSPGIHIVHVETESRIFTEKFLVQ